MYHICQIDKGFRIHVTFSLWEIERLKLTDNLAWLFKTVMPGHLESSPDICLFQPSANYSSVLSELQYYHR